MLKSLRARVLAMMIGAIAVTAAAVSGIGLYGSYSTARQSLRMTLPIMTELTVGKAETRLKDYAAVLQRLAAEQAALASAAPPEARSALLAADRAKLDVLRLGIADREGRSIAAASPEGGAIAPLAAAASQGAPYVSNPYWDEGLKKRAILLTAPITARGQTLYAAIDYDLIGNIFNEVSFADSGFAYVLDEKGNVIIHKDLTEINDSHSIFDDPRNQGNAAITQFANAMIGGATGLSSYMMEGERMVVSYAPVPGTRWSLALTVNERDFLAEYYRMLYVSGGAAALFLLAGILLAIRFAGRIGRPVAALAAQAESMAAGDLRREPQSGALRRGDEIGGLARAFHKTQRNLKELLGRIAQTAEHVSDSARGLKVSAGEAAAATAQIASTVTAVAEGAARQSELLAETKGVVGGIHESIASMQEHSQSAAQTTWDAADAADEGGAVVARIAEQMRAVETAVGEAAAVVARLGDSSQQIGQIVDTISAIAGQTNLLALNAAIEAARAGEMGRGFAVVAEEVRKLAEQSDRAAQQVGQLIASVQAETESAVASMRQGSAEVEVGGHRIDEVKAAFGRIQSGVEAARQRMEQISAAVRRVTEESGKVVAAVERVDQISRDNTAKAESLAEGIGRQSASMDQIAVSADGLSATAGDLQQRMEEFKL